MQIRGCQDNFAPSDAGIILFQNCSYIQISGLGNQVGVGNFACSVAIFIQGQQFFIGDFKGFGEHRQDGKFGFFLNGFLCARVPPYFSFLAVLNFGTSWLSREIVFTILLLISCALLAYLIWFVRGHGRLKIALGWFSVACGWIVIYCMASLYLLPTQPIWHTPVTILKFFGSALLLGAAVAGALLIMDTVFSEAQESDLVPVRLQLIRRSALWFALIAVLIVALISLLNLGQITGLREGGTLELTSLHLLTDVYGPLLIVRFVAMFVGVIMLAVTMVLINRQRKALADLVVPVHLACLLMVVGEILGRFLFYATHVRIGV